MALLSKLARKFKAAGERLRPEFRVLEPSEDPMHYPSTVKLYEAGTEIDAV